MTLRESRLRVGKCVCVCVYVLRTHIKVQWQLVGKIEEA